MKLSELKPETVGRIAALASIARDNDLFGRKDLHANLKAIISNHTSSQVSNIAQTLQKRDKKKYIKGSRDPKSSYQRASGAYVNIMRNLNKEQNMAGQISEWGDENRFEKAKKAKNAADDFKKWRGYTKGKFVSPNDPEKGCWGMQKKEKPVSERILEAFSINETKGKTLPDIKKRNTAAFTKTYKKVQGYSKSPMDNYNKRDQEAPLRAHMYQADHARRLAARAVKN